MRWCRNLRHHSERLLPHCQLGLPAYRIIRKRKMVSAGLEPMPEGGITFISATKNFEQKRPQIAKTAYSDDGSGAVELKALRADMAQMRSMIEKLVVTGGPPQRGSPSNTDAKQAVRRRAGLHPVLLHPASPQMSTVALPEWRRPALGASARLVAASAVKQSLPRAPYSASSAKLTMCCLLACLIVMCIRGLISSTMHNQECSLDPL